jgi:hypothetical protein
MHPHGASTTTSTMEHRRSPTRMVQRLKIIQDQAGHAVAATTAIYTGVSDEYRNRLLKKKLTERHAGLWEDDQP